MKKTVSIFIMQLSFAAFSLGQNAALPASVTFERKVVQYQNGEDGKATNTYYFTINGDYSLVKREEEDGEEKAMMLYTKDGRICMIDESKKTITIMNMPKFLGSAAEAIEKSKLPPKEKEEDKMTVTKTGKTKTICGYTAYEYQLKNEGGSSSWWYAQVDFNPVKIYTMGAGNGAIAAKMKDKKEELKNNPMAIPVLNQNYLMAEIEVAGKKGLETKSISKESFVFSTAGYSIKEMKGFGGK